MVSKSSNCLINHRCYSLIVAFLLSLSSGAIAGEPQVKEARGAYARLDYDTAFRILLPLAQKGDVEAQTFLGGLYASGRGTKQDGAQAVYWLKQAAEKGDANAQCALGLMYLQGQGGLAVDPKEAALWIRKAAERDHGLAQYWLSEMYASGYGVPNNAEEARRWKERFDNKANVMLDFLKKNKK